MRKLKLIEANNMDEKKKCIITDLGVSKLPGELRRWMWRIGISFIMILILHLKSHAQSELRSYQEVAAANNPTIQSLYKEYEASLQRLPQVRALPDPVLGGGYFISPVETRVGPQLGNISFSQQFPWFGLLTARENAASEKAKAIYMKMMSERSRINFDVAATYNNYYILNSAQRITVENIELLNTFMNLALVKFESGSGSMVDVLRVEMELSELDNQLKYLNDSEGPLDKKFEELLNQELTAPVLFPEDLWIDTLSVTKKMVLDSIIINNPSLIGLDHKILALNQEALAANKAGAPSFNLGLNYIFVGDRTDMDIPDNGKDAILLPTVGVRLPIYRKKYVAMVKEKEIQQESIQLYKVNIENQLKSDMELVYRDYADAVRRVDLYNNLAEIAGQALDILIAEYTTAVSDFEEIIIMNRQQLKYELELEKAQAQRNTAVAYINYLMGK